jgi:hypothetical protein
VFVGSFPRDYEKYRPVRDARFFLLLSAYKRQTAPRVCLLSWAV